MCHPANKRASPNYIQEPKIECDAAYFVPQNHLDNEETNQSSDKSDGGAKRAFKVDEKKDKLCPMIRIFPYDYYFHHH